MRCVSGTGSGSSKWDKITAKHACSKVMIQESGSTSAFKVIVGDNLDQAASAPQIAAGQSFNFFKLEGYTQGEVVGYVQWQTGTPTFTQRESNETA